MAIAPTRQLLLGRQLVSHRRRAALIVAGLGLLFAFCVVGLAAAHQASVAAVDDGVVARRGIDEGWSIQANSIDAERALDATDSITGIGTVNATVFTPSGADPVRLVVADDQRPEFGKLISGVHAATGDQVTVSAKVADLLGIGVGDSISLDTRPDAELHVVGIVVDPSDPWDRAVYGRDLADYDMAATSWVAPGPFDAHPILRTLGPDVTASSVGGEQEALDADPPGAVNLLSILPYATLALLGLTAGGVLLSLASIARRDIRALIATGYSPRDATATIVHTVIALWITGGLVGTALAHLALSTARVSISGLFDQRWVSVSVPGLWVAAFIAGSVVSGRLGLRFGPVVRAWIARQRRRSLTARSRPRGVVPALAAVAGAGLLASSALRHGNNGNYLPALGGFVLVCASVVLLLERPTRLGRHYATRSAARLISTMNRGAFLAAIAVVVTSASFAAVTVSDAELIRDQGGAPQPPGSLVIESVPASMADGLIDRYTELGGESYEAFSLLDAPDAVIRVGNPALAACATDLATLDECMQLPEAILEPVGIVFRSSSDTTADIRSSESHEPGASVIAIRPESQRVDHMGVVETTIDSHLGGNIPSLVLTPGAALSIGIETPAQAPVRIALFDFNELARTDQATLRRDIGISAPASLTSDTTGRDAYAQSVAIATAVASIGGALAALILSVSAISTALAARRYRQTLTELGMPYPRRLANSARAFLGPLSAIALSYLIMPIAVEAANRGWNEIGTIWTIPGAVAAAALLVAATVFPLANTARASNRS
jgi:hypothetical protein